MWKNNGGLLSARGGRWFPPEADRRVQLPLRNTKLPQFKRQFLFYLLMEFLVYILYSDKHQKHYTGYTSNLVERFKSHNYLAKKGFTMRYRPWRVIHIEVFDSKSQAMKREHFLKTGMGRKWVRENIKV